MPTEIVKYRTEREWLEARTHDVTSTDVAALPGIDVSPYKSPWELFMEKSRPAEVAPIEPNERMKWGSRLQDAIAQGAVEELGVKAVRLKDYLRIPEYRIGSSFDFLVVQNQLEGLLEVKNVDGLAFQQDWREEDGLVEAPPHIELQVQHQLLVSGYPFAYLVALVGGNRLVVTRRTPDDVVGRIILRRVAEFWEMVRENHPPPPDFRRDARLINALYNRSIPGQTIDLVDDCEADVYVWHYMQYQEAVKSYTAKMEEFKAKLLEKIGTAERACGLGWTILAKEVGPTAGTYITPEMVGKHINQRKGYRKFLVTPKKGESK